MAPAIRDKLQYLVDVKLLRDGELDAFELRMLGTLSIEVAEEVLECFQASDLKKIANKSGLLSGIMRRLGKEHKNRAPKSIVTHGIEEENSDDVEGDSSPFETESSKNDDCESSRAHKKRMEAELKKMLEEEGFVEGDDDSPAGSYVGQLNALTGLPRPDDVLMFVIPVCAPYLSLRRYKYNVKLTPGTQKKGKASRSCIDIFARSKDCLPRERDLIKLMSENEVVQAIVGDVKVSAPGLHATQNLKRKQKKGSKGKKKN